MTILSESLFAVIGTKKISSGIRDVSDAARSGRPCTVDDDALAHALKNKPAANLRELAEELQTSHATIHNWLR